MFGLRIPRVRRERTRDLDQRFEGRSVMDLNLFSVAKIHLSLPRRSRTSPAPSPEQIPIGFPAPVTAQCGLVMRYRSATVAGFHGLPC
jgi:hypothetical protein